MSRTRAFLRCPHCNCVAYVRTSVMQSKLKRESAVQCNNVLCGHTFTAVTQIVRTLSPSACPSSDVSLPVRQRAPGRRHKSAGTGAGDAA
ncbi:ogr/Delta-like zinc finger family protein [Stenotrophomonas sp. B1-1]|uniref:ogr/Delta-like zinc finger family protein n=1 Tax=Stenotrophomonas sp. B1-1 TaxID=2710648 RepID=UPI0013D952E1|nr:ogr/Delta-like zinc finger family protein [Stenotrophomonas sp. B1-1]